MRRCSSAGMELRYLFALDPPGLRSASTAFLGIFLMFPGGLLRPIFWAVNLESGCVVAREYSDVAMTEIVRGGERVKGWEAVERKRSLPTVRIPSTDGVDQNKSQGFN